MAKTNISIGGRTYPVYIEADFSQLSKACAEAGLCGKMLVVTDSNVDKHYSGACVGELAKAAAGISCHVIEAGEKSKTLDTVEEIYRKMILQKLDRNSTMIALGGGVTGDIAGFAAATYMRGVNFVQIPTSLIAQADSSIGGKTGVDFDGNKNMIGAFYQPCLVYINVNTLRTLPERELKSGLSEVIKHGLIMDAEFFDYIDNNIDEILKTDENTLKYVSKMNCSIKGGIVEQDERESGLRAILNFGHTIGHAVESESNFTMLHGECVSIGMAGACRLAFRLGMINEKTADKIEGTLKKAGLPIKINGMDRQKILDRMYYDKKIRDGKLNFVLPRGIGEVVCSTVDDLNLIDTVLTEIMA